MMFSNEYCYMTFKEKKPKAKDLKDADVGYEDEKFSYIAINMSKTKLNFKH